MSNFCFWHLADISVRAEYVGFQVKQDVPRVASIGIQVREALKIAFVPQRTLYARTLR